MPPKTKKSIAAATYIQTLKSKVSELTTENQHLLKAKETLMGHWSELRALLDSDNLVPVIVVGDAGPYAAMFNKSPVKGRLEALIKQNRVRYQSQLEYATKVRLLEEKVKQQEERIAELQNREAQLDRCGEAQQHNFNQAHKEIARLTEALRDRTGLLDTWAKRFAELGNVLSAHDHNFSASWTNVIAKVKELEDFKTRNSNSERVEQMFAQFAKDTASLQDFKDRVVAALNLVSPGWSLPTGFVTYAQAAAGAIGKLRHDNYPSLVAEIAQLKEKLALVETNHKFVREQLSTYAAPFTDGIWIAKAEAERSTQEAYELLGRRAGICNHTGLLDRVKALLANRDGLDSEALLLKEGIANRDRIMDRLKGSVTEALAYLPNVRAYVIEVDKARGDTISRLTAETEKNKRWAAKWEDLRKYLLAYHNMSISPSL